MAFDFAKVKYIGGFNAGPPGGEEYGYKLDTSENLDDTLVTGFWDPFFTRLNPVDYIKVSHAVQGEINLVVLTSNTNGVTVRSTENTLVQSLTGTPLAVDVNVNIVRWTLDNTGNTASIPDGREGQIMRIIVVAVADGANTGIITPVNKHGFATITLTDDTSCANFLFTAGAWAFIGGSRFTIA